MEQISELLPILNGILIAVLLIALIVMFIKINSKLGTIFDRVDTILNDLDGVVVEATGAVEELKNTTTEAKLLLADVNGKMAKLDILFDTVNRALLSLNKIKGVFNSKNLKSAIEYRKNKKIKKELKKELK